MSQSQTRIALFISNMNGAGAQGVVLALAQGMIERGYAVDLVLAKAEGAFLNKVPASVRLIDLKASRVLASLPALIRYLRREQPTVLYSTMHYINMVAIWAKRLSGSSTRLIVSVHNSLTYRGKHTLTRRDRLIPFLIKRFYPWADGIVTVSAGVAQELTQTMDIPDDRIQVIYNPVVGPELKKKVKEPLEHPWFDIDQPPVVLAVGRLSLQKDFPTLIEAFAKVRQNRPVRLLILGEGQERPKLETLIKHLNLEEDVCLPGFVSNPYPYMAQASVFILSSQWEGLGNVLIEALYCGAPTVSTDCPFGPREILDDGHYGQLVPVGNVDSMAQAIEQALMKRDVKPSQESWRRFEVETVVDQYLNVLLRHHE